MCSATLLFFLFQQKGDENYINLFDFFAYLLKLAYACYGMHVMWSLASKQFFYKKNLTLLSCAWRARVCVRARACTYASVSARALVYYICV